MDTISDSEHMIACEWVKRKTGVSLDEDKKYLIETRLEPVSYEFGFNSLHEMLQLLEDDSFVEKELELAICSAITTHETSFFRDLHPFNFLQKDFIPSFLKREHRRELSIWSGACSNGQEIYSVAMLILEHFQRDLGSTTNFYATDICMRTLEKASKGSYSQSEISRGLHAALLIKYFMQHSDGRWVLKENVRDMVNFEHHNLIGSWENIGTYDVIFLRNVLIYFEVDLKKLILDRIKQHLRPGGVLFLGGSESTSNLDDDWKINSSEGCVYYTVG